MCAARGNRANSRAAAVRVEAAAGERVSARAPSPPLPARSPLRGYVGGSRAASSLDCGQAACNDDPVSLGNTRASFPSCYIMIYRPARLSAVRGALLHKQRDDASASVTNVCVRDPPAVRCAILVMAQCFCPDVKLVFPIERPKQRFSIANQDVV